MQDLQILFSQHSIEELIIFIVLVLVVVQGIWKTISFFLEKYEIHTGKKIDGIKWKEQLAESLEGLNEKMSELSEQNKITHEKQEQLEDTVSLLQERMQENTRSYLIDAHHRFCYQLRKIDDLNLESLERRYLYYKSSGGDTFIDHLMEDIRELPRVNFYEEGLSHPQHTKEV